MKITRQGCGTGQCSKPGMTLPFAPLPPKTTKLIILIKMTLLCNTNYAHMQCVNCLAFPLQIFKCPPPNPRVLSFPLLILIIMTSLDRHWGCQIATLQHEQCVNCVAFCPTNPNLLVTVSDDKTIKMWTSKAEQRKCVIEKKIF